MLLLTRVWGRAPEHIPAVGRGQAAVFQTVTGVSGCTLFMEMNALSFYSRGTGESLT